MTSSRWLGRFGSHRIGVWVVKHVVSPLDRLVLRASRGRLPQPSSLVLPTVLLTVAGRRSGLERTVPLVFVRDGGSFVVGNARPAGERRNPWVANLLAAGRGRLQHRRDVFEVTAREVGPEEVDVWWPQLVEVWPAFADHFAATRERTVFVLTPSDPGAAGRAADSCGGPRGRRHALPEMGGSDARSHAPDELGRRASGPRRSCDGPASGVG